MRVYIAAPWTHKTYARLAAEAFEGAGHTITKKWWDHPDVDAADPRNRDELAVQAVEDIKGVQDADAFVLLNEEVSEGKSVETGLALAFGVPIIIVGGRTNVFHHLPAIPTVPTIKHALDVLREQNM